MSFCCKIYGVVYLQGEIMLLVMEENIRFNISTEQSIVQAIKALSKEHGELSRNVAAAIISFLHMPKEQRDLWDDLYILSRSRAEKRGTTTVAEMEGIRKNLAEELKRLQAATIEGNSPVTEGQPSSGDQGPLRSRVIEGLAKTHDPQKSHQQSPRQPRPRSA